MSDAADEAWREVEARWAAAEDVAWSASRGRWNVTLDEYKRQRDAVAEARRRLKETRDVLFIRLLDATRTALAASKVMQHRKYVPERKIDVDLTGLVVTLGGLRVARISIKFGQVVLWRLRLGEVIQTARDIEHADPILLAGSIIRTITDGPFEPIRPALTVVH